MSAKTKFYAEKQAQVNAAITVRAPAPTELHGEATHGYAWTANASGYTITRNGIEVAVGPSNCCVETNAQRAVLALTNRGIPLS